MKITAKKSKRRRRRRSTKRWPSKPLIPLI